MVGYAHTKGKVKGGCGAAWVARLVWVQEVGGSNPSTRTTKNRPVAKRSNSDGYSTIPPGIGSAR